LLKKTAADTWSLDTSTYLTGITSAQVTTALGFTPYNATNPNNYISGNQSISINGDITGSGTTNISATLATVNSNVGSFGSATAIPVITVNAKGLVTAVSTSNVSIPSGSLNFTGDVTGTGTTGSTTTLALANSGVTAGTYTNATLIVDAKGRITSASSAGAGANGNTYARTSVTATAGQTTFSVTYTPGLIQVYVNGVLLNASDYTASNGTTVVLASAVTANEIVEFIVYGTSSTVSTVGISGSFSDLINKPTTLAGYGITTAYATETYVTTAVSNLINSAPAALDTLQELATALGNDANYSTTITTALSNKQPLDADLTAIAALAGTSGLLKKTAADTWSLDTSTYLTSVNSTQITTALGYTPFQHYRSATAPTSPNLGDEWYDTSANVLYKRVTNSAGTTIWLELTALDSNGNRLLTNPTIKNYTETPYSATVIGNAITISLSNSTFQNITTMNGANAITLPTPSGLAGKSLTLLIIYANTPSNLTFTVGSGAIKWSAGTTPTTTLTNGKIDLYTFVCDGTNWYGTQTGNY
jgi:hypothetical protein